MIPECGNPKKIQMSRRFFRNFDIRDDESEINYVHLAAGFKLSLI